MLITIVPRYNLRETVEAAPPRFPLARSAGDSREAHPLDRRDAAQRVATQCRCSRLEPERDADEQERSARGHGLWTAGRRVLDRRAGELPVVSGEHLRESVIEVGGGLELCHDN